MTIKRIITRIFRYEPERVHPEQPSGEQREPESGPRTDIAERERERLEVEVEATERLADDLREAGLEERAVRMERDIAEFRDRIAWIERWLAAHGYTPPEEEDGPDTP